MILKIIYNLLLKNYYKMTFNKRDDYDNVIIFNDHELLDINFQNDNVEYFYINKNILNSKNKLINYFGLICAFLTFSINLYYLNLFDIYDQNVINISSKSHIKNYVENGFSEFNLSQNKVNEDIKIVSFSDGGSNLNEKFKQFILVEK